MILLLLLQVYYHAMNSQTLIGDLRHFFTFSRCLALLVLLCSALVAQAQQYRWVDEKGRVQYTDTPPPPSAKGVEKKQLRSGQASVGQEPFALQTARRSFPVRLFSMPECGPACDDARKLLLQRGVPFNETSITKVEQMEELKRLTGSSVVPVMLVGSKVEKGYEAEGYHRALDSAGYPKTSALAPAAAAPAPPKPAATGAAATPATPPAPAPAPEPEPAKAATR